MQDLVHVRGNQFQHLETGNVFQEHYVLYLNQMKQDLMGMLQLIIRQEEEITSGNVICHKCFRRKEGLYCGLLFYEYQAAQA